MSTIDHHLGEWLLEDFAKARDRSHLVPVKREYTSRRGTTYTRTVYVRPDQAKAIKKDAEPKEVVKDEEKPAEDDLKISDKGKEVLNETVNDLRKIKPGAKGKSRGTSVERHADGKRFKIGGVVAYGFKAAALMVAGVERVSATAASFGTGSLEGGRELAAAPTSKVVERVGKKAVSVGAKAKEVLKKK